MVPIENEQDEIEHNVPVTHWYAPSIGATMRDSPESSSGQVVTY
ncbi:hypothetical protein [Algoriphagus faecimaris]|nr:hypothetical protein [Algoriphagus faecimaris]